MATSTTESNMSAGKKSILFVFTSASKIGTKGHQIETGWWISEGGNLTSLAVGPCLTARHAAAHPYWLLHEKFNIDFASPEGPNPPLDPASVEVRSSPNDLTSYRSNVRAVPQRRR